MFNDGFDNDKYFSLQTDRILKRISQFGGKLYLEFGGKLFDDYHASRVLPGFKPDTKINMLLRLKDKAEIVVVVSAAAIEQNKMRADLGITYDMDALRLIDAFRERGLYVGSVCITHYASQPSADSFIKRLGELGIKVFKHFPIPGYPTNVKLIVSDDGYGKNEYIETSRQLVVITAPGPGSGKMATALSQLYHDAKRGIKSGYAKFETFPVWNLPLTHPVNLAYESATADLNDVNMIDPFHLEAYGETTVNYNRDVEIFPVLRRLFEEIYGECPYKSPTDMGVNMVGFCISDDKVCCEASKNEIIRRYYEATNKLALGACNEGEISKIQMLFNQAKITTDFRRTTVAARECLKRTGHTSSAIELEDGTIITGNSSPLLGCSAALLLNVTKHLAGIDHTTKLIPQSMIEPIQYTKTNYLGGHNPRLHTDEVLVALSVLSENDENCRKALEQLPKLRGCQVHCTVMLSEVDRKIFKKLGIGLTCEPVQKKQVQ